MAVILLIDDEVIARADGAAIRYFYRHERVTDLFGPETSKKIHLRSDYETARHLLQVADTHNHVIIDLGIPYYQNEWQNDELREQLHQLALQSDSKLLANAYPTYRDSFGDNKQLILDPTRFILQKKLFLNQNDQQFPFGVLLAKECKKQGIPFTVYTNDWNHGSLGIILLACAGIMPVESIVEVLKRHLREPMAGSRTTLEISDDHTFAIGYKWILPHWQQLIDTVVSK